MSKKNNSKNADGKSKKSKRKRNKAFVIRLGVPIDPLPTEGREFLTKDHIQAMRSIFDRIGHYTRYTPFETFVSTFLWTVYYEEYGFLGHEMLEEQIEEWKLIADSHEIYNKRFPMATQRDKQMAAAALELIPDGGSKPKGIPKGLWELLKEIYLQQKENI